MNDEINELDDPDCTETYKETREQLEAVECILAERYKIRSKVRQQLLRMDREKGLEEDEVVMRWHDLYASYVDWAEQEGWQESTPPPPIRVNDRFEGAAESGPSAFVCFVHPSPV